MFFLAGLGFLRVIWFPFNDASSVMMRLGEIIYLSNDLIIYIAKLSGINIRTEISVFFIVLGVLIFVLGVYIWLKTKFSKQDVAKSFIYKISRHPQYLGWIIWSYGLFLMSVDQPKKSWSYPDSLPWLLSTMIIITIALLEEIHMQKKYGKDYSIFKSKTAFMFPIPKFIKKIIKHPILILFKEKQLKSRKHVFVFSLYYSILFIAISYLILAYKDPTVNSDVFKFVHKKQVKELTQIIYNSQNTREKDLAAYKLEKHGDLAIDPLLSMLESNDYSCRIIAIRTLGRLGAYEYGDQIFENLNDSKENIKYETIKALASIKFKNAESGLIECLSVKQSYIREEAALALAEIGSVRAMKLLMRSYFLQGNHTRMKYINAFGIMNYKPAELLLISQLSSEDKYIKEAAIIALTKINSIKAIDHLRMLQNEGGEIRIYAKEAIKRIEKNYHSGN